MDQEWDALFTQALADFPDERVVQEAEKVLEAMGYEVQQNGPCYDILRDIPLTVIHRSLHSDERLRSGGFLALEVAVGPRFTAQGVFNGVCEYGLLRLEFGLDGSFQDDSFVTSPLLTSSEVEWEYEQVSGTYAFAERQTQYGEETEQGDS
ncbi:MAG: hypothetical protein ISS49_12990 [Anaerolineae bacterium]|nr:hypothetical protein [Anaerolineae bacterium]